MFHTCDQDNNPNNTSPPSPAMAGTGPSPVMAGMGPSLSYQSEILIFVRRSILKST